MYAETLADTIDELLRLLMLIDFRKVFYLSTLSERTAMTVREAIQQKQLGICSDSTYLLYCLAKEKALELDVK